MRTAKTVKEVLIATRWIIENIGWCQGTYYKMQGELKRYFLSPDMDGKVLGACLSGAVLAVDTTDDLRGQAALALASHVDSRHPHPFDLIVKWNDKPNRTRGQVLAIIDQTLNSLEKK